MTEPRTESSFSQDSTPSESSDPHVTGIRLAGVSFEQTEDTVTVHWLLGGLPQRSDCVTFVLQTLERELRVSCEDAEMRSMTLAPTDSPAEATDVDYEWHYALDRFSVVVPNAHLDLHTDVFTMQVLCHEEPCGEWTGSLG
ncbi:hypothetical protein [Corynebacterium sp.]|uniref:hypothetical protein n=1 Tax=Corynebacterium sp. TaxID=1720 RepID=UPI0026DB567D|nr:hypothetical protein [Corynebacterium sp.]MDO5031702.1 hypothetical protein [Corynebacterium sp.]